MDKETELMINNLYSRLQKIEEALDRQTEILLKLADVKKDTDLNTARIEKVKDTIRFLQNELLSIKEKIIEIENRPLKQKGELFNKLMIVFLTAISSGLGTFVLSNFLRS